MRTTNSLKHLLVGAWLMSAGQVAGQASVAFNNGVSTDFLGWNNGNNFPLSIAHKGGYPIQFRTNNTLRAILNANGSYTIGSFAAQNADGYLGLSPNTNLWSSGPGPFSRLHLHDGTTAVLTSSYRPWMKNGITFTTNSDHMWVGHKVETGTDQTSAVIQWGDNELPDAGPDVMKFVFTSSYTGGAGINSLDGREIARMHPQGYLGVGDWLAAGTNPTERVDMLNGRLRIRDLPSDQQADGPFKVMVVDDTPAPDAERGVVKWRDANQLDCKWNLTVGFINHLYTAVGTPGVPCPDDIDAVGIGIDLLANSTAPAKFTVRTPVYPVATSIIQTTPSATTTGLNITTSGGTSTNQGMQITATSAGSAFNYGSFIAAAGGTQRSRGIHAETSGATITAYAGEFFANDASPSSVGVLGRSNAATVDRVGVEGRGLGAASHTIGVLGSAQPTFLSSGAAPNGFIGVAGYANSDGQTAIGVYGEANPTPANSWAGYFQGDVNINGAASCTASAWTSDGNLKTNIEELSDATGLLEALRPRTYLFDIASHPSINLPAGLQRGFVAQELEQVMPDLVSEVRFAGRSDSTGAEVVPGETVKAVNYIGLIPVLVAAMQEQNARIAQQDARIAEMQAALASCCAIHGSGDQRMMIEDSGTITGEARSLRIVPNPFNEGTTLHYTLEKAGRMQLLANSADGKQLKVLHEAQQEAGTYQHAWSTAELSPGVYYVTLLLDGEPIVKKAVKVVR